MRQQILITWAVYSTQTGLLDHTEEQEMSLGFELPLSHIMTITACVEFRVTERNATYPLVWNENEARLHN
jgi:hypothetical protein